jgi:hypothetical protein
MFNIYLAHLPGQSILAQQVAGEATAPKEKQ